MAEEKGEDPMSDPRLIECAKALRFEVCCMAIPEQDGYWAVVERPDRFSSLRLVDARRFQKRHEAQEAVDWANARACILKWLEQEPSERMEYEAEMFVGNLVRIRAMHRAMCEQARKELSGDS